MRILLLSFYYPPDIGPGPLRAKSLVEALKRQGENVSIDVMTTLPNRYNSFYIGAKDLEEDNTVSIHRFQLPKHRSGMLDQAMAFTKFVFNVITKTQPKKYDLVVATSSRLFTAALAAFLAKKNKAKLYLDIRDLFVETMEDVLRENPMRILIPLLRLIEKWTFNAANRINVVSGGFLPHLKKFSLMCDVTSHPNGVDLSFVNTNFEKASINARPLIVYAGNIGQGQGLEKIIPKAAKSFSQDFNFIIVGDGGGIQKLENALFLNSIKSVKLLKPMSRKELMDIYTEADILFLHLTDFDAFKKVLPSKIFEYAATGKPILAGVSGFAADFLNKNVNGAFVFQPNNVQQMEKALRKLMKGAAHYDRANFVDKFMREKITQKMAAEILSL